MKVYVLRFITQTQGQWKVFFREPDKFSADLHQAWNLHLLHIRQEQSSCRQGCSSNVVGTGICSVYSTTSSDFTVKIFCSDPLKHMRRDSSHSSGVPYQRSCVHADQVSGCSAFVFSQSFQEPSRFFVIHSVVGIISILSVAEEFGGSKVSFGKIKHPIAAG